MKNAFTKASKSGVPKDFALLCLRTTPVDSHLKSPAELLFQRKARANLPMYTNLRSDHDQVKARLQDRQSTASRYHDIHSRELPPVHQDQPVMVQDQDSKKWSPGVIHDISPEPRSYTVAMDKGGILRRNRQHIAPRGPKQVRFDLQDAMAPPKPASPAKQQPSTQESPQPALRRSTRTSVPPKKLNL